MKTLDIDLTDAARALGLPYVPKVIVDPAVSRDTVGQAMIEGKLTGNEAGEPVIGDGNIHVAAALLKPASALVKDVYKSGHEEHRIPASITDPIDAVRFVLAHELSHFTASNIKLQEEFEADPFRIAMYNMNLISHDQVPAEPDADKQAEKVWKLVKAVYA